MDGWMDGRWMEWNQRNGGCVILQYYTHILLEVILLEVNTPLNLNYDHYHHYYCHCHYVCKAAHTVYGKRQSVLMHSLCCEYACILCGEMTFMSIVDRGPNFMEYRTYSVYFVE